MAGSARSAGTASARGTRSPRRGSPLGEDYFARYGTGSRKTDYARSWKRFTFSLPAILRVYRARFGRAPRSLLDLGAADGSLMREALRRGLRVRGVENSPYILARIADPALRRRIRVGDAADLIREIKPGGCDVIVECAAQYLSPRRLDRYLRNLALACAHSGMVCLLVDPRGYGGDRSPPHTGVRTYETAAWWRRKLREAGFLRCEQEFYFFKA